MIGDMRWSRVLQQIPKQTVYQTEVTSHQEYDEKYQAHSTELFLQELVSPQKIMVV